MCAVQLLRVSVHERINAAAEDFLLQLEKREEAAELPALRALLTERLTAAAEEIVGLLEETVAEYEDRVERSEREICRQRRLLDAVLKPEVRLHRADIQQLLVRNEDQNQDNRAKTPQIKEEQEELWSSQEAEITKFSPDSVKSEEDEEKPQSLPFHQRDSEPEPEASELSVAEIEVSCEDWEENNEAPSGFSGAKDNSPEKPLICGKTFPNKGFLETHMMSLSGEKPLSCSMCGKKYSKKGFLLQHMAVHQGERRQNCSVCNRKLVWQAGVECHQCVGRSSQQPAVGGTRCNKRLNLFECDKRLCYSHHLKKDMGGLAKENLFTCSVCGRKFTQRGYLMQHMDRHTGKIRFRCCVCHKRFAWRHNLKNHKCGDLSQSNFGNESGGVEPVASDGSDTDDKTSDSSEPEAEGRDGVYKEPQQELNSETDSNVGGNAHQKSFICPECGKIFCGEDNIKMHMKTHAGEKPFSCSFCDKGLMQTGHLTNHLSDHSKEKRFLYCVCGKRFAWRYNRKNSESLHTEAEPAEGNSNTSDSSKPQTDESADNCQETSSGFNNNIAEEDVGSDTDERPFSCSQCGKRFRRKKNLQEHLRIHTGEKPYGCSVCMKYFSCSGSLRKHMRIHTGEKPFSCSVCGNRFTESGHLKVHMRTHTGEKPFSCSVCGKSFTWRQSFNNHMKYHSEGKRDVN